MTIIADVEVDLGKFKATTEESTREKLEKHHTEVMQILLKQANQQQADPKQSGEKVWVPGADYRLGKPKMPFDGEDAYGWVYCMERFFDIQGFVNTGERLRVAVLCMEGQALSWYHWSDRQEPFRHWEGMKARLLERFQPSQ